MMYSPLSISTEEDRISSLPDPLICHLLSFLPTKQAVTTSVLSKRWTPLWKSILTLDFDDESFTDFASFRYFVYSVIVLRDATLPIRTLRIRCRKYKNRNLRDLNRFVQAAVQRGLEICELNDFGCSRGITKGLVPGLLGVLSCKTLVVLKLENLEVYEVPDSVHLPLLKTLRLDGIDFTCSFAHFVTLVRGCPILQDFYTTDVLLPDIHDDFVEFNKGFSKLVRANIGHSEKNFLFPWLYNVKFLRVILTSDLFYRAPPTFHNLTHLEMELPFFYHDHDPWPLKWDLVIQVLQQCPNLQNLTIDEDYDDIIISTGERPTGDGVDGDWTEPKINPECFSSQLRKCSLQGFCGMVCELQFVEYILLNSKLLCTMIVKSNRFLDGDEKLQKLVKLTSFQRGSVTCKLLFD